eukprot:4299446-Amphidinium_carterae.1
MAWHLVSKVSVRVDSMSGSAPTSLWKGSVSVHSLYLRFPCPRNYKPAASGPRRCSSVALEARDTA